MQINATVSLSEILPPHTTQAHTTQDGHAVHNTLTCQNTLACQNSHKNKQLVCQLNGQININNIMPYLIDDKLSLQIGVDEAGRGPLLGSVLVGAVMLPPEYAGELKQIDLSKTSLAKLNDSKKISEKKRNELYQIIPLVALGYVSVEAPATIIDEINILQASLQGMRIAVNALMQSLSLANGLYDNLDKIELELLFDGNRLPPFTDLDHQNWQSWGFDTSRVVSQAVVKGDSKFASIAAASVIAKFERDKQMYQLATEYPNYGIANHKGYPTKAHLQAIEQYGVLKAHRRSFAPVKQALT